jgi:hypothetical protein
MGMFSELKKIDERAHDARQEHKPRRATPSRKATTTPPSPPAKTPEQAAPEARPDVTPSGHQDVDYRAWREIIENTETHNSALRLTRKERYEVEDVVSALERQHKIKTSMNELARLGLLALIHDYKQNTRESLLYKVKKS